MSVIDDFLKNIEPAKRKELVRIRSIALKVIPLAQDAISYGMPTLKYKGVSFLGFNAHVNHIGIYPYGGEEIETFTDKLKELHYGFSKGAIQVPLDRPIPENLLTEIIKHRIGRISDK